MNNFYTQIVKLFNESFSDVLIEEISTKYSISKTELKYIFDEHLLEVASSSELTVPLKTMIKGKGIVKGKETSKVKKTINRKVPDDTKRCIALTKGNERCKSSKSNKNGHSFLCSLHTKNGVDKYGVLEDYKEQYFSQEQKILAPIEEDEGEDDEVDNKIEKMLENKPNLKLEFVE